MHTLSDEQVKKLLVPRKAIAAIEEAFRRDYRSSVQMPIRTHLHIPSTGVLLTMPCYDSALPGLGIKLVSVREGAVQDTQRIQATYVLLDPETGSVQALLAANYLTDLRTAATSAIATTFLARMESRTLGIFGTGRQARAHISVLPEVRDFQRVLVCGSRLARSQEFARRIATEQGLEAEAADARKCVVESDVICTCTTSNEPVFDGRWLRPGTHLNLVGAFRSAPREVDDETIRRARVMVDTYEGALAEAGDLLIPLQRGIIKRKHILADLHEIVSGKKPGRKNAEEITVFKSVGCALEDLVTARLVYEEAIRQRVWDRQKDDLEG